MALGALTATAKEPVIEKELLYDQHTLADTYDYNGTTREFQYDKMKERLAMLDSIEVPTVWDQGGEPRWAILQNHRNEHGTAPLTKGHKTDEYHSVVDRYGVMRNQSVPLYAQGELGKEEPECYGRDGSLARMRGWNADSTAYVVEVYNAPGVWEVPTKFVRQIDEGVEFTKVVMIDRPNQNIATLEKVDDKWLVRSMNPCSTGAHNPPFQRPTPQGVFVIQDRQPKMFYTGDGNSTIVGYAPWASRITNGAYMHGVPVNNPNGSIIEFSTTLGTTPRSHECVRNASSHAKFIYDWAPVRETLVFVYD